MEAKNVVDVVVVTGAVARPARSNGELVTKADPSGSLIWKLLGVVAGTIGVEGVPATGVLYDDNGVLGGNPPLGGKPLLGVPPNLGVTITPAAAGDCCC